ncbi:MAG: DUF3108 domain-containing protein [Pseudomonadota bacterium]
MNRAVLYSTCLTTLLVANFLLPVFSATQAQTPSANKLTFATLPTIVKATYKVYRNGILVANVDEKFERFSSASTNTDSRDRYKITSDSRTDGAVSLLIREQLHYISEGRIGTSGLTPDIFTSTRKSGVKHNFTARFDWDKSEIIREQERDGSLEKETFDLPAGTQDRLSSMYQFMLSSPHGQSISTHMTQGKSAELYTYLKLGELTLTTPAGEFDTVHYARDAKPGESKAQMWLAKSKNYLPVRIIFEDAKGTTLEQSLIALALQ